MTIKISKKADADIENIIDYTISNFGVNQASKYYEGLNDKFNAILDDRAHSMNFSNLIDGMKRTQYEKHFIYYQKIESDIILIVRVLHQSTDAKRHFVN